MACGLQGGMAHLAAQASEAEAHLLKTEYMESRRISAYLSTTSPPGQPQKLITAFGFLNLATIDIATGVDLGLVKKSLDRARDQFRACGWYSMGATYCDEAQAHVYLHQGNIQAAKDMFHACFWKFHKPTNSEGIINCGEQLADLGNHLHNTQTTLQWTAVFLASALKFENQLATMKALRCLGDIFLIQGDEKSAMNLFEAALDGFTFMDVHQFRADCMVRMADILGRKGDLEKPLGLMNSARVLYERSGRGNDVLFVDGRIKQMREGTGEDKSSSP
ncbi:hypothetical protein C8J57DRAFT_1275703 [Mycena rebaudengoi]|nr:hypothetical protein C8J57DRAFT_1275703 [Mycena rebaudengoi]